MGGGSEWRYTDDATAVAADATAAGTRYKLFAVISHVAPPRGGAAEAEGAPQGHLVLHVRDSTAAGGGDDAESSSQADAAGDGGWLIFNDMLSQRTFLDDVRGFGPAWKNPCILLYRDESEGRLPAKLCEQPPPALAMPPAVFSIPSFAQNSPGGRKPAIPPEKLPGEGAVVALDAEFVCLEMEEVRLRSDGSRVVTKPARQGLARVSVVDAEGQVIIDDYIIQTEPVLDHLTRFSGVVAEDLNPFLSQRPSLVPLRAAYLKLRCLVDRGCVLVGHGLAKDLRVINLVVPPSQVLDTAEMWSLPGRRKASLRFLSHYLLSERIQESTHDSVEDSRMALALCQKYEKLKAQGSDALARALDDLYQYGYSVEWKVRDMGPAADVRVSAPGSADT
ncbi:exonuclease-domain-containing protein [Tribonema minus]|uniref:Exonuclease-domain-containing protein n=1 Tax=Tribonema minus TaxID=303371 RepID=A0A836CIT6_9STRA|nr:exonuclease-domain-containing protein [Tribonema minus]